MISENIAKALNLRINGINVSENYLSRLVELKVQLGQDIKKLEAPCIPSTNINLKLPNLDKVVQVFQSKGYVLDDEFLTSNSTCINNINLILGTKSSYRIPDSEILFGKDGKSVYSQTPYGIILKGEVNTLVEDADCLTSL